MLKIFIVIQNCERSKFTKIKMMFRLQTVTRNLAVILDEILK